MAVAEPEARASGPGTGHLLREIGVIGLLWASVGSIIGSGWLFGAQGALATAGPAAIISWVIGGIAILILALCFVATNLVVDLLQTAVDPRIKRA